MSRKIRFLLSGPGLIGRQHAKLIDLNPNAELAVVVAPESNKNYLVCQNDNPVFYTDFNEAVQLETVDAAIISSPNEFHFVQAMACIEKGIPVLIEKPITDNINDSYELCRRSSILNVPVLVGHHRTYNTILEPVKAFIESDKFGRLVAFSGHALFYKPQHYFAEGVWRTRKGGGPILINLIHEIGLMRYLCGEISSVFAVAKNNIRQFEVEDTVVITLIFENGALGSFVLSDTAASDKSWELTSAENPSYPTSAQSDCYHFSGTNGSFDFPTMNARFYHKDTDPSWWNKFEYQRFNRESSDSLNNQLSHFIDVITGKEKPLVSAWDGHINLLVVDAIMRSLEKKTIIDIISMIP